MKKLLIASTALSLAGGAAFAEMAITVSGDAEMGVDYASEPAGGASKHSFVHEVGIDFEGSGTTDGGLTFGGSAGFDTGDDVVNTGTVNVSGSFGTLTIGDNDSADLTAGGIADIGMNGIGVDDMVEGLRGTTAGQLRYDNSFGQVSIAISAGTSAAVAAVPHTAWTITEHGGTKHVINPIRITTTKATATVPSKVSLHGDVGDPMDIGYAPMTGDTVELTGDDALGLTDIENLNQGGSGYTQSSYDKLLKLVMFRGRSTAETAVAANNMVLVDHDADGAWVDVSGADPKTAPINIYGWSMGTDGKIYKPGATAGTKTEVKDEAEIDAFKKYAAVYSLGADKAVGGEDVEGSDKAEDKKADTIKATPNGTPAVASDSEYAFGMSFNAGGVTIGVGYDSKKTVSMGAGFTTGEITTNLLYVKTDEDFSNADGTIKGEMTGMGVDMAYAMGASTVTLSYGRRKPETGEAMDAVGMGVTHDLGGGATMNAGFGKVDKKVGTKIVSENKASVGLMFAF